MGKLEQITASAGSGKTYTLIQRFLSLLAASSNDSDLSLRALGGGQTRPHAWPEILAATFTNAAASEMKERLMKELKKYALKIGEKQDASQELSPAEPPLFTPEEARERIKAILRRFGSLNIRTIDSLLTMLVRLSALPLGLPPNFEPVFENGLPGPFELFFAEEQERARSGGGKKAERLRELLLGCCRAVLAEAQSGGFMAPPGFEPTLLGLIEYTWENAPLNALPTDADLRTLEAGAREDLGKAFFVLRTCIAREELTVHKALDGFLDKIADWCTKEDAFAGMPPTSAYLARADLQSCLLKSSAAPSEEAETAFDLCRFAYSRIKETVAKTREAKRILPYARLAAYLAEPFRAYLLEKGLVPSQLTEALAKKILHQEAGPSEAYCRFGARLEHLLLDEFQDTSRKQWRAIAPLAVECLAGGGDLIYVGDVKQAIYGWRGGDADLFYEIPTEPDIARIARGAEHTPLPANWRSLRQIVTLNNHIFTALGREHIAWEVSSVLLGKDCPEEIIAENTHALCKTFADAAQEMPGKKNNDAQEDGYVCLVRLTAPDEKSGAQGETEGDGAEIVISYGAPAEEASDDDGNSDADSGKLPPRLAETRERLRAILLEAILTRRPCGDVAILTRGNSDARLAARWLADWGLPTLTENSLLLNEHPLITQVIAFLRFMDNPLDDSALLEFLCAEDICLPVFGLGAPELRDWALRLFAEAEQTKRVDKAASGGLLYALSRDFPDLFERWLAPFYNQAGLMSAYDLTCAMLGHFGVWERQPGDAVFLRRFLELLHRAESREMKSLGEFLDYWGTPGNVEKLPGAESLNAVRIMTIHKAKGLEFPVVIAPFNDFGIKALDNYSREGVAGGEIPLKERRDFGAPYFRNLARQSREALHLIYVAWTRAEQEFYAILPPEEGADKTGRSFRRQSGPSVPVSKAMDILLRDFSFSADGIYSAGAPVAVYKNEKSLTDNDKNSADPLLPDSTFPQPASRPMDWLPRLKIYRNVHEDLSSPARERGVLIHNCLENLHWAGDKPEELEGAALRAFMHARRILGMPRIEEARYWEIMGLLIWVLSLPEAEEWFATGRAEQEILEADGSRKIMDRLVFTKGGATILEYKTGYLEAAAKDLPLPEHVEQLQHYLTLLEKIHGYPAKGQVIYLDRREIFPVYPAAPGHLKEGQP